MLSCHQVTEIAPDYFAKRLSCLKRLELAMHLAMCPNCRRYLRQVSQAFRFLDRDVTKKVPPKQLYQTVLEELRQQER